MTLPRLVHPCAAVLSMYVWMCNQVAILGGNIRSCMIIAPRSKLFIVTSLLGLDEDTRRVWVVREKKERQTKY